MEKNMNKLIESILNDTTNGGSKDTNNASSDATNTTTSANTCNTNAFTRFTDTYIYYVDIVAVLDIVLLFFCI